MSNLNESTFNRRHFLGSLTALVGVSALLTPTRAKAASGCGADKPRKPCVIRDGHLVASSVGCLLFEHYHELQIPLAAIQTPPAGGLQLRTNHVSFHSHSVTLTQQDLIALASGKAVTVSDGEVREHEFTLQMPQHFLEESEIQY